MELLPVRINMESLIPEAYRNLEKLPAALISSGVVQAAVALALVIYRSPPDIFLDRGKTPLYLYYDILVAVIIFGFMEASAGFYVSDDLTDRRWRVIGMTILWVSILPIVFVARLGGFVIVK